MNVRMWQHPATVDNMAVLQRRGVHVVGPDEGVMACNEFGPGRLAEPSAILAAIGLAFAHFIVLPHVVFALIGVTNKLAVPTFGLESTLNFILIILLVFALIFQTPIVMIALARIGLINSTMLRKSRRIALFGFFVIGGIAAPDGNPVTMAMIALPMYVLFEGSLWIISVLEKSWHAAAQAT